MMRAAHDGSVDARDILGEHDGTPGATYLRGTWWSGGTWLRPGECVAVLPRAVVTERKP